MSRPFDQKQFSFSSGNQVRQQKFLNQYANRLISLMGDANNTGNLSCDDYSLALNWLIEDSCESYLNEGFGGNAPEHCCRVAGLTMPNGTLNDSDLLQLLWVIGQAIGTGNPNYFDCDETGS